MDATLLDALVTLNESLPLTTIISAIENSPEIQVLLATPGDKTLFAPSDSAIAQYGDALTMEILKNHIFEGNLTASDLLLLTEIVAVSGAKFRVTSTVVNRRGRRATFITVGNDKGEALLTRLDIPSGAGVVHGTDRVLLAEDSKSSGSNELFSDGSGAWSVEWIILACAALLFILFVLTLVTLRRTHDAQAREPKLTFNDTPQHFLGEEDSRPPPPEGPDQDSYLDLRNVKPTEITFDSLPAPEHGADPDAAPADTPGHFYPAQSLAQFEANMKVPTQKSKKAGKLVTPQHPSQVQVGPQSRGGRRQYLDPASKES